MESSLTGKLLVAGPAIIDLNFARTVVLVCDHDENGALGLVLDRPSDVEADEHLPDWAPALTRPPVVFLGGPVEPAIAVGLGTVGAGHSEPPGWRAVVAGVGLVDLAEDDAIGLVDSLRVFSGYAGWAPGQLEAELAEPNGWIVVEAVPDDLLTEHPERLRRAVLRRQTGSVRLLADYPADPGLN
ncbi:YqgE/AlgH family protein [bacterium]|nr:YqgE/AlgH family protein [bacterium]